MINYVAHWDRILIQSRSKIINELNNYEFRSICPIVDDTDLKKHYSESLNWQISREKFFDFSAVFSLRKILKNFNLEFLGFSNQYIKSKFTKMFPEDKKNISLENWDKFENENPDSFRAMYQFWVKKNG